MAVAHRLTVAFRTEFHAPVADLLVDVRWKDKGGERCVDELEEDPLPRIY
jgi:hypothetical protein